MSADLEQRYRRALRLLPGYYRDEWEEDMVAAFLDGWLTGDAEADAYITSVARPSRAEVASVAGLAVRQYLGGAGAPRRYFAWGQATRNAVLAAVLVHAAAGLYALVTLAWVHRLLGVPAPPATVAAVTPGGIVPPAVWYVTYGGWLVIFVLLALGRYRIARALAVLAVIPDLVWLLDGQLAGRFHGPTTGPWAQWVLISVAPVLAMAAFHRDAPPTARRPWLLALPVLFLLVYVPLLALQATGNFAWMPDSGGLLCIMVAVPCLVHVPGAWSGGSAGSGVWSLSLVLLAAVAGIYRVISVTQYAHDPHLIYVSLVELLILLAAAALVAPDAARAQAPAPAPPPRARRA
jgi:hypothetical protein